MGGECQTLLIAGNLGHQVAPEKWAKRQAGRGGNHGASDRQKVGRVTSFQSGKMEIRR